MAAPVPPLPPLEASPVSADTRLAYVLRHFRLAYEVEGGLPSIGYADTQPDIEVADAAGDFFSGTEPYAPPPAFLVWMGRELPFFFAPGTTGPLLTLAPGRAEIHVDVVSAAFYLLSGWQEYYSEERDQHGRFPFAASVQDFFGFVEVPVVNYYFDVLRRAVEHVTGRPLRPRRWADGAPFATFVTHDIDNLYSAWKEPAKAALRRVNAIDFLRQVGRRFTHADAWDNLAQLQQAVAQYGARSTYFFLGNHRPSPAGTPNADYRLRAPAVQQQIRQLHDLGAEIAIHGSLGTDTHEADLWLETEMLPVKPRGNRFHYLRWEPRITPHVVESTGFEYDSTLGFAEHFGFRHSYCLPFHPFNFEEGEACRFLEIPLNLMDATLHHPRYLQLAPDEILPAIEPMLQEIERFGGVFTLLWHNENFDPANTVNGPREFHRIMAYLRSRQTAFLTGRAICEMVK
ncbi:DUF7033 domain-containing protein [Hymenobacter jeollabukensis]|uniref:DUF7033 domain-containing protein n=1 Tax=Hymenobacter jeollabukensis TaxID=2025313 RepID=A0A5R8WWE3_9BACT|nr:hypothetical protein [Hymenobacter jeollabukensis]TLM96828.1 hypothetical protein FDY95_02215 [Hymenobacter jeollabukensis]